MATVYLAEPQAGRQVAIKVLRPELAAVIGAGRFPLPALGLDPSPVYAGRSGSSR